MHQQLDPETLLSRVKDYNYNATVQTASLVMGGLIAIAGVELLEIIKSQDDLVVRLALWGHTLSGSLVFFRYQLQSQLAATTQWPYDGPILFVIFGVFQIVLFALLLPIPAVAHSWRWWFVAYLAMSSAGLAVATDVVFRLTPERLSGLYGAELAPMVPVVRSQIVSDVGAGVIMVASSAIVGVVAWLAADTDWIIYLILAFVAVGQIANVMAYGRLRQLTLLFDEVALKAIEARKGVAASG